MEQNIMSTLQNIKKYLDTKCLDYYEIRFENHKSMMLNIKNLNTKDLIENENQGVGIRIYTQNKIGFLSLNNFLDYKKKIDNLIENVKKTSQKIKLENFSEIKAKDIVKYKSFENEQIVSKNKKLISLNKEFYKKDFSDIKVLSTDIIKQEKVVKKYFLTPSSEIYQEKPYSIIFSLITAKKNNQIQTNLKRIGGLGGLEKHSYLDIQKLIKNNLKELNEILESKPCPALTSNIILHPSVSDLLAHEAIGHACEGDAFISKTSVLKKGLKISKNQEVNITDNPTLKEFGYFKYDDEGVLAKKTELVKNGIVNDFLTNIETASLLRQKSNGSARAENYNCTPIVRMSNTYFEPGKSELKDMLHGFNGYLLKGFSGGQVDPNIGTFMFGIKQAYKYKNGKLVDKYKQASISGNILTYLNKISEISNKKEKFEIGFCGKESQTAFVGGTGPYIKIKNAIVGGTKHE